MADVELDCEDFLDIVYGEKEGWIDLPAKVGEYWVPCHLEWPDDSGVTRRIDSSIRDEEDLYYSVAQFSERGRRIEDVLPTSWLWADLDEVHPTEAAKLGFLPTIAVESSPSRYQALWKLNRELQPKTLDKLNRGLTYALGADRGGYDLTQVLRLPGTRNFKYPSAPRVELMWFRPDVVYDPKEVWASVKDQVGVDSLKSVLSVKLPKKPISAKARQLLRAGVGDVVKGERSAKLWELECLLAEAGLDEDEIYDLVVATPWNKWKSIASGKSRLHRDISKAINHVQRRAAKKKAAPTAEEVVEKTEQIVNTEAGLPFIGYSSFMAMSMPEAKWLIRDIWTADSHGIIGGEPKTNKTTLALALSLSVASGKPFLGEYPVGVTGPVLFVQEENAPWMMQDRLRKLAAYYGLLSKKDVHIRRSGSGALGRYSVDLDFPVDVPLKILNNYGFDLAVEEHREMLVAEIEEVRPKLLVLDPLYLILGGANENQSHELRPFLKWLLHLRYEYNLAVIVIHHMRKQQQNGGIVRAGQRMMGNAILHGWIDSALYCFADAGEERERWVGVNVEREFRSMAPQRPLTMGMTMGDPGSLDMEVEISGYDLSGEIKKIVTSSPGVALTELGTLFGLERRAMEKRVLSLGLRIERGGRGRGNTSTVWPST